ncbi:hypothetical protein K7X08_003949 [Anisodus acutangulus]|uniref:Galectin domain-containing protein n=1 Tax=Anisodus acutangulus TaxID=402998 RepID=A0A9Q1RK58_9SOLA|nr:hypothetical protein K7X08_003949 [Anisodus acutangulus]
MSLSRQRMVQVLIFMGLCYVLLVGLEVPLVFKNGFSLVSQDGFGTGQFSNSFVLDSEEDLKEKDAPNRPIDVPLLVPSQVKNERKIREIKSVLSSLVFDGSYVNMTSNDGFSGILKSAKEAFEVGKKFWKELELHKKEVGMQWGTAQRCDGWRSRDDEETVDGQVKCEKWIRDNDSNHSEQSKATWWLNRLVGRKKKVDFDWPFPFSEDRLFVLTLSSGLEGYHVNVDGRHVTSFPYRIGFALEDATGLSLNGDIDVDSVFAASLPTSHPNFAPQRHLDMSNRWKAPPLLDQSVDLFIGVLSAANHFAERMAIRRSWMQHQLIKSSNVVARFFVALHARKDINVELKKEAEFFGDVVIVPFMDNYDLVVLKTAAICEYGVHVAFAKNIMKCDDDTFVRVDAVIKEINKIQENRSLYVGNINYYHKPLRNGKWAVTYEEWPEEDYPPYANGPGYIISSAIANFIVSEFDRHKLKLFKMEDVSMGMWVEKFNSSSRPVQYVHSLKFSQAGCVDDYYTAHYQSPRQMICMWNKLQQLGRPQCCNMR